MAAVQDLLTCPICLEWFDTPKHLPCGHVYCLKDLQPLVKPSGKLECPECRREHDVPNGDVAEFPLDYRLMSFINPDATKKGKCTQCRCDKPVAICEHCDKYLCIDCTDEHTLTLTGLIRRLLKEFAREFVKEDVKQEVEDKKVNNEQKRETNYQEQNNINDKADAVILAVEKRREVLLVPFLREITELDKEKHVLNQLAEAEKFHREIKHELDESESTVAELKLVKDKIDEMTRELRELVGKMNEENRSPSRVDFQHQCDRLHAMIEEYGQGIADYQSMKLIRTLNGEEHGQKFEESVGNLNVCPHTDNVYFTNINHKTIDEYEQSGNLVRRMNVDYRPYDVAVDSQKRIIVTDPENNKVRIYDQGFQLIKCFGDSGTENGEFNSVESVVCDDGDNIYVSDTGNHRIQKFDQNGGFICHFGSDRLKHPMYMQVIKNGKLLVSDWEEDRKYLSLLVFTLMEGNYERRLEDYHYGPGMCVDRNGYVLLNDIGNGCIRVLTPELEHHARVQYANDICKSLLSIAVTRRRSLFVYSVLGEIHILH